MTFLEQMVFTNRENRFMRHCGIRVTALVSAYSRALGGTCVTLDGNFRYLRNVTEGTIVAEARPVKLGRTILVFQVQVKAGGTLLGEGSFSCYQKET